MIILFEEDELLFQSLGLGLLKDARSCYVGETINDTFELELVYPKTGALFSQIKLNRIIFTKPNPYTEPQPFRIYSISKPINGVITVKAVHISYDMNGLVVAPISGTTAKQTLDKIQNGSLIKHNFKLYTDLVSTKSFTTNSYYNMRALLLGSEDSVLEKYKGEILFDKFNVYILERRGSNKGAQVRYAKNMKDINHEVNYERLYNGVYPFYHQETTETTATTSTDGFKQVYIVGTKPFQDGWLSYTADGDPYHPVDESPVQIATDGDYYGKVYTWNTATQRYSERIYNEMVNLVECVTGAIGVTDRPSWIYIDVSALPTIVVRANESGYFKLVSETEWTKRAKGEVVYQGSILNVGDSLLMYYSEVIPTVTEATENTTTSVTHVELKDKIIYLDTPAAKEMKHDRIMCLDLTSEFDETPDEDKLKLKAEEYIEKNKIGQYKYETTVSFVDLANTTEGTTCKKMENIELGDVVRVVYEGLDIDIELRVITTKYNAILDRYDSIELGEKPDKLSSNSVQTGDNVSSLTNDIGYTDITTVNKLIAKTITADLIQAKNAKLSQAQIEELQTARIKITGMIEATQFEIDKLVAKMLIADNAEIKHTLEAGEIKVKGDITVTSGEITLINKELGTVFNVDRNGNVEANSVKITGGELNINDTFSVTPEGIMTAHGAEVSGNVTITSGSITLGNNFKVSEDGTITAYAGEIAGFIISKDTVGANVIGRIKYGIESLDDDNHDGVYIGTDGIRVGGNFYVTDTGELHADSAHITGEIEATTGSIAGFDILTDAIQKGTTGNRVIVSPGRSMTLFEVTKDWSFVAGAEFDTLYDVDTYTDAKFAVSKDGYVYASALNLRGGSIRIQNDLSGTSFYVNDSGQVFANAISITGGNITMSNGGNVIFSVDTNGHVEAKDMNITGGSIVIRNELDGVQFIVTDTGKVTCKNIHIIGGEISLGNPPSYHLDRITDVNVIYTVVENVTSVESGDYKEVLYNIDLSSLEEDILPEDCCNLSAGTRVPKFRVDYWDSEESPEHQEPDGYDYYWYVGTIMYNGVLYDRWVKVEDPHYGDQSFNTNERTFLYCTQVVQQDSRTGAYFYVDNQGNLTATSVKVSGEIHTGKGSIGGFTITENSIQNGYDDDSHSQGIYLGSDCIRIGDRIDKSFISKTISIDTSIVGSNGCVDIITDNNNITHDENYAGSVFILYYSRHSLLDREVTVVACDSSYNPLPPSKEWTKTFILKAGTSSFELELCNSQYFRFYATSRSISSAHLELKICPGFTVNNLGELYCVNATVRGTIISTNGNIGGFTIDSNSIRLGTLGSDGSVWVCAGSSTYANIAGSGNTNGWTFAAGSKFGVKTDGTIYAASSNFTNANITGGKIKVSSSYSEVTLGEDTSNTYGLRFNMVGNIINMGYDGTVPSYDSTNPDGYGIFSNINGPFILKYTYKNYSGTDTSYRSFIMMRHAQIDNAPASTRYYGFKTGIRIYQNVPTNSTYGPSVELTTDIRINWVEKAASSGAYMTGYWNDIYNVNGGFRGLDGRPTVYCYGNSWANDGDHRLEFDLGGRAVGMWCHRQYVSSTGWQFVPWWVDTSKVISIVTGHDIGSYNPGNANQDVVYKIVDGYPYVALNKGTAGYIDIVIFWYIDY